MIKKLFSIISIKIISMIIIFYLSTNILYNISYYNEILYILITQLLGFIIILIANIYITKVPINYSFKFSKKSIIFIIIIAIIEITYSIFSPHKIYQAFMIGILSSIPEEYLFRGVILGGLLELVKSKKIKNIYIPILISSLIFSMFHLSNLTFQNFSYTIAQMIQVFGLGIFLSALYIRTHNLLVPIIAHFTLNSIVTFMNPSNSVFVNYINIPGYLAIIQSLMPLILYTTIGLIIIAKYNSNLNKS